MPAQRHPSQTTLTLSIGKTMLATVDEVRTKKLRGVARAQFIRDAIAEKLSSMGISLPDDEVLAPVRGSNSSHFSAQIAEETAPYKAVLKKKPTKKGT